MDGDPVAAGIGVNINVYDDRVSDEAGKCMSGKEFGGENPYECRHVTKRAVGLEVVQTQKSAMKFLNLSIWILSSNSW